jgi:hypothetical protein
MSSAACRPSPAQILAGISKMEWARRSFRGAGRDRSGFHRHLGEPATSASRIKPTASRGLIFQNYSLSVFRNAAYPSPRVRASSPKQLTLAPSVRTISLPAAALVVACTAKAQDSPSGLTFKQTTSQGREARIHTYTQQRPDCSALGLLSINITTPPAHGTVSLRPGSIVVGDPPRFGGPDCRGKRIEGLGVRYTPAPGYVGADQFDWNVSYTSGTGHDRAIVEVK